ncbi:hypothetical protein NG791_03835 [Laspinema sp. D1]|uniref:hypothetical protein n=1 Tax=Laspinema palackyanum TaxID=3231601 RepID=UPI00346F6024|nr:hypothetical protein [Laspinema sp. D2b]
MNAKAGRFPQILWGVNIAIAAYQHHRELMELTVPIPLHPSKEVILVPLPPILPYSFSLRKFGTFTLEEFYNNEFGKLMIK